MRRELIEEVELKVGEVQLSRHPALALSVLPDAGLLCQALSREFRIDGHEIEAARWLSKDEARARLANRIEDEMKLPVAIAIAHHLIRDWASR